MASIYSAIECPHCGRTAIVDDYYKIGERFICCDRCGYSYSRVIERETDGTIDYKEESVGGHGVFMLVKKEGSGKIVVLDREIDADTFDKYSKEYFTDEVDQDSSYLLTYTDGVFSTLLGKLPEDYLLPFKESQEKEIKETIHFSMPADY